MEVTRQNRRAARNWRQIEVSYGRWRRRAADALDWLTYWLTQPLQTPFAWIQANASRERWNEARSGIVLGARSQRRYEAHPQHGRYVSRTVRQSSNRAG